MVTFSHNQVKICRKNQRLQIRGDVFGAEWLKSLKSIDYPSKFLSQNNSLDCFVRQSPNRGKTYVSYKLIFENRCDIKL